MIVDASVADKADGVISARRSPNAQACASPDSRLMLNHMVHYSNAGLDAAFAALSDATRRGVLEQLGRSEASISDLADRFHMTPTGMKKHVAVLEAAGLVATAKVGRVRRCRLGGRPLGEAAAWIEAHRRLWAERFDALDAVIAELREKDDGHEG